MLVDLVGVFANPRFPERSIEQIQHLNSVVENTEINLRPEGPRIYDIFRRLGTESMQLLVARYEAGAHTTELMKEFGISKSSVLKVLRDRNVTMRRQSMTPEQIGAAIQLYELGNSLKATADELELPKQSVRNALFKAGVTMRPSTRSI